MLHQKQVYKRYKLKSCMTSESKNIFGKDGPTPDLSYMNEQMKKHIEYFEFHKVYELQSFIKSLHSYGCRSIDQRVIIEEFLKFMKERNNIDIFLLKKREMIKANAGERNILINVLAYKYPNEFLSYLRYYIYQNFPQKNKEKIILDFQTKINKLIHQVVDKPNLTNENKSLQVNVIDDHIDQSEFFDESAYDTYFDEIAFI